MSDRPLALLTELRRPWTLEDGVGNIRVCATEQQGRYMFVPSSVLFTCPWLLTAFTGAAGGPAVHLHISLLYFSRAFV